MLFQHIVDLLMNKVNFFFPSRNRKIRYLEAVTVCVNYSQFLEIAISNKKHFDKWFIVTTKEDSATIELCKKNNLECVLTERLHENGDPFNKGKAINDGLIAMTKKDWIIHIDADTILPDNFREIFLYNNLINKNIYTCKYRAHCPDKKAYLSLKNEIMTSFKKNSINAYTQLDESIVHQEQLKRNQYCLERGKLDGLYRDSLIKHDDAIQLQKEWLNHHKKSIIFEKNNFDTGCVQLFHSTEKKFYSESYKAADRSDSDFFLKFHDIQDESDSYKGMLTKFIIRHWQYIEIPYGFGKSRQSHMICFHIGESYTNWNGL